MRPRRPTATVYLHCIFNPIIGGKDREADAALVAGWQAILPQNGGVRLAGDNRRFEPCGVLGWLGKL
jgi:hypothetical protein